MLIPSPAVFSSDGFDGDDDDDDDDDGGGGGDGDGSPFSSSTSSNVSNMGNIFRHLFVRLT